MELYRYLIDDFLIEYCRNLKSTDFKVKTENVARNKQGKREYLLDNITRKIMKRLELHLQSNIEIPRTKHGNNQTIETLINEEALLFEKFIRNEKRMGSKNFTIEGLLVNNVKII